MFDNVISDFCNRIKVVYMKKENNKIMLFTHNGIEPVCLLKGDTYFELHQKALKMFGKDKWLQLVVSNCRFLPQRYVSDYVISYFKSIRQLEEDKWKK